MVFVLFYRGGVGSRLVWRTLFCFVPEGKGRGSRVVWRSLFVLFLRVMVGEQIGLEDFPRFLET